MSQRANTPGLYTKTRARLSLALDTDHGPCHTIPMDDHPHRLHLWLVTDGKAGHRSQLQGLSDAFCRQTDSTATWVDAQAAGYGWGHWMLHRSPALPKAPLPQLLVAAGRRTHPLLLGLKRRLRVPAVVIMRPSFPLHWVDGAVIPEHDQPPRRDTVLPVKGALNPMVAQNKPATPGTGMILLGGPSRHYHWDEVALQQALHTLTQEYPDWHWTLATSRRTPESLVQALAHHPALHLRRHDQVPPGWLREELPRQQVLWATPDSVSMVSEALSTGRPTGVLPLTPRRQSRVVACMTALRSHGYLYDWSERQQMMTATQNPPLQESDRAASWLRQRFFPEHFREGSP